MDEREERILSILKELAAVLREKGVLDDADVARLWAFAAKKYETDAAGSAPLDEPAATS